jgi:hypothetical protein
MLVNAFHPDYIKTHHPELLSKIRAESFSKTNGEKGGRMVRATRENTVSDMKPLATFPKTKRVSTAVTEFHVYSKAGMPKGVK